KGALARLTRGQETELPREVSFGFTDGAADYRRSAVTSRRLVGGSNRTLHSDFAVITDDAAATRRADIWLQDLWAGRENIELSLGMKRLSLAPGDVIGVTVNARRRLFEISELVDTQSRQVKARSIDPEVFSVPLFAPRVKPPMIPPALGPVQALVLDLPSIDSSEPPVLTRLAIFADPWPGSVTVWRSTDGLSFEKAATAFVPSIIGETLDPLPAGPASCWDLGGEMRVALYGGVLASVADARVLDGANAAAVLSTSGVWEILQFANAELAGDKTYRLSRLLRGQAGSEYAIADPLPAGSPFVLLDDHVVTIARGLSALDRAIDLRIVATGRSHDDPSALALTVTPQPTALMPLSPVHVKAVRAGDGIHVSWIRRTRRDGDNWGVEVPLGEDTEAYTLDILSGTSVVRSMSSAAPSVLYANADELADFGTPQPSLHGRVSQMSSTVGRGHPAEFTLTL
ncbi:MAG: phage tail protein, partial [Afipia sp.]